MQHWSTSAGVVWAAEDTVDFTGAFHGWTRALWVDELPFFLWKKPGTEITFFFVFDSQVEHEAKDQISVLQLLGNLHYQATPHSPYRHG